MSWLSANTPALIRAAFWLFSLRRFKQVTKSWRRDDTRDTIRSYKDTIRKEAMEFGSSVVRVPIQQELKNVERIAAYNAGDIDKVTHIDEREEERRKRKAYHRSVRKYRGDISKASYSKSNSSSLGIHNLSV